MTTHLLKYTTSYNNAKVT